MYRQHSLDLEVIPVKLDPALYFTAEKGILNGLSGAYVNVILRAGNINCERLSNGTGESYKWQSTRRYNLFFWFSPEKGLRKMAPIFRRTILKKKIE